MSNPVKSLLKTIKAQKKSLDKFLNPPNSNWNVIPLKKIIAKAHTYPAQEIAVGGWVKTLRQRKFIQLSDGSTLATLQLICPPELAEKLKAVKFGSYLIAQGKLALTPEREQSCELKVSQILWINSPHSDYPLQKQKMPLETIRNYPHLRTKTNYFLALFRLRHTISKTIHDFFDQEGFYYVPTPIITSNDTEGAGETFNLTTDPKESFFSKPAKLTVSGQLHAEALAQGLGRVYTFSPCFRAEKSHTTRHLAEFWMVEAELTPADLTTIIKLTEKLIKFIIKILLKKNLPELTYLENYANQKALISLLKKVSEEEFVQLDYTEAIELLKKSSAKFAFGAISWGMNLQAEHEKYLCSHYGDQPLFITDYPRDLKAFYMKNNLDGKTVESFDLIFPQIGEVVGGSIRESNYETLKQKAAQVGINTSDLAWYLELRQAGYAPSGGFGLGLERLIMFIGGIENIQDTLAFPLFHKHLKF